MYITKTTNFFPTCQDLQSDLFGVTSSWDIKGSGTEGPGEYYTIAIETPCDPATILIKPSSLRNPRHDTTLQHPPDLGLCGDLCVGM